MSFFEELKRRNVVRVGIAYAVASWIILQLTDVVGEILNLPQWGGQLILVMLAVGFVLALFFAWAFELTPEGIKREAEVDRSQSMAPQTSRKLDRAIIGLLVLGLAYFIYESRFMDRDDPAMPSAETNEVAVVMDDTGLATGQATQSAPEPDRQSIAVLPFANRSLKQEDQFFTDGIHDDLLTQLAKINGLKVVSRTSVMQYRDTQKTIAQIAGELGVGTVLEGGIQRAGDRVRINAQLIDVNSDQHLWAETFDREMTVENIFDIQSEITRQITQAVRGELNEAEQANLAQVPTSNLEAYEAYLKALALINKGDYDQKNYQEAEVWANQAVQLDPEFALAWAMLVEIHGQAVWIGYDASEEREARALEALINARRFGPGQAETIAAEAEYAYRIQQDFPAAVALFRNAHEALPGDADVLYRLAIAQRRTEDLDGAEESFKQSMVLDPNNARPVIGLAELWVFNGELEKAQVLLDRGIEKFPDSQDLKAFRVEWARSTGDQDLIRSTLTGMTATTTPMYFITRTEVYLALGDLDRAIAVWDEPIMQLMDKDRSRIGSREAFSAWAYSLKGEPEAARAEAERCIARLSNLPPGGGQVEGFEMITLGYCYVFAGEPELAVRAANQAQAAITTADDLFHGSLIAQYRAHILAMAGRRDEALQEIERLLEGPFPISKWRLYQDVRWDFFRDDERFNELIRPDGVEAS